MRALEEEMATHSSILAWRIPRKEEPGRLQSVGFQRVGHGRSDLARTHGLVVKALDLVDRTGKFGPSPLVPYPHVRCLLEGFLTMVGMFSLPQGNEAVPLTRYCGCKGYLTSIKKSNPEPENKAKGLSVCPFNTTPKYCLIGSPKNY